MEKDPELGPWVNRYTHLREDEDVIVQLFCDKLGYFEKNEESCNTDNWIRILTIAAVLQEYEEYQVASTAASNKGESLLLRLSLYFKDEITAKQFLDSARLMKTNGEIIELVKKNIDVGIYHGKLKTLWNLLKEEELYTKEYKNWCAQIKKDR